MHRDLEKLQGTWNVSSLEVDGQKMRDNVFGESRLVVKAEKFTSLSMGAKYEGTLEIGPAHKPKTLDLIFTAGPEKGNRNPGIYKLDGDTWTICLATRGTTRPKKFVTQRQTGIALQTLQRNGSQTVKGRGTGQTRSDRSKKVAAGDVERADNAHGPATELEGEWAMVSGVFNGEPLEKSMVKFCKRVTRGNVTSVVAGPQVFLKATFTLDSTRKPRTIDYMNIEGASAGKSQVGIFELDGDTLSICMAAPGKRRPADFSSTPGDDRTFTIWRLIRR